MSDVELGIIERNIRKQISVCLRISIFAMKLDDTSIKQKADLSGKDGDIISFDLSCAGCSVGSEFGFWLTDVEGVQLPRLREEVDMFDCVMLK